jgi:DnaK suppressor protein
MAKPSTITTKKVAAAAVARKPSSAPAASAAKSSSNRSSVAPAKAVVAAAAKGKPAVVAKGISAAGAKAASNKTNVGAPPRVIFAVPAHNPVTAGTKVNGKHAPALASARAAKTVEVKPSRSERLKNGVGHAPVPPPRPIPEAVPTDGKPRKNQAGLTSKELEHFRAMILDKRRELVGDMVSMESEALRTSGGTNLSNLPLHMADMGTDNYEQEFTLGLVEKDRNLLRELNGALAKIQNGTYGICEGTGKPITKVRLEAQPWARFSIEHARSLERRLR